MTGAIEGIANVEDWKISDLPELSNRTKNALEMDGYFFLPELLRVRVQRIPNLGKKGIDEIKQAFYRYRSQEKDNLAREANDDGFADWCFRHRALLEQIRQGLQ